MKLPPDNCPVYNHINLTRSLKLPHGSLTPGTDPEPRWPALRSLGKAGRLEARQEGDDFTARAALIFGGFLLLFVAAIAIYLYAPLLGL